MFLEAGKFAAGVFDRVLRTPPPPVQLRSRQLESPKATSQSRPCILSTTPGTPPLVENLIHISDLPSDWLDGLLRV
jgi:hypothetical protein